jgi:2-polyprenyl-3-methyl-5-hydroxy-6-metoxy-1,4-benzoquinol methylase
VSWSYYDDPRPDIQAMVLANGRRVLDVGCGGGALGAALKEGGAAYVAGIERHPEVSARAQRRLDAVVVGDILSAVLPFSPGEFDYIIFADVLEHLPEPEAAIHRILPYLSSTGRVVVSVPNIRFYLVLLRLLVDRWAYTDHGIRDRTHLRIFTKRSLEAMLASCGLNVERLARNYRLFEDQSRIGRAGAIATRIARMTIAPLLLRDLMVFQYVAVARRVNGDTKAGSNKEMKERIAAAGLGVDA